MSLVLDKKNLETLLKQSSLYVRGKAKIKPTKWVIKKDGVEFWLSSNDKTVAVIGKYNKKFFEEVNGEGEIVFDAEKVIKAIDRVFKHSPMIKVYADGDKVVFEDKDGRSRLVIDQSGEEVVEIDPSMVDYIEGIPVTKKEGVKSYLYRAEIIDLGRLEPKEAVTITFGKNVKVGGEITKGSYAEIVLKSDPIRAPDDPVVANYPPSLICPFAKTVKIGGVIGVHVDKDGSPGPLILGEKQEDHVVILWALPLVTAE